MCRASLIVACMVALVGLALQPASDVAAAGPTLLLNPTSGNPPLVSGSLSGTGWQCSSGVVPMGEATVSGTGVAGTGTIDRDGSLSGSFTVRGAAGQSIEVEVTAKASCPTWGPPVYLQATTVFAFEAPTPTPTTQPSQIRWYIVTPQPTPTPTPTSTSQLSPTSTPTAPQQTPEVRIVVATVEPTSAPTVETALTPTSTPEPAIAPTSTDTPESALSPTPTATTQATVTAVPTPTASKPPLASLTSGQGSLTFVGCTLSSSQVNVELLPLGVFAAGGTEQSKPSGAAMSVPAVQAPNDPQKFTFQVPSAAETGRIYQVSVKVDNPDCPLDTKSTKAYWVSGGKDLRMPLVHPGSTTLEMSNNADQPPKPVPQIKGAFVEFGKPPKYSDIDSADLLQGWVTNLTLYGSALKDRKQRFQWSTDLTTPISGTLQVGWLPFPNGYEENPLSPPGLLASWPVDCVSCEFVVDLSSLPAPEPEKTAVMATKELSWLEKLGQLIVVPFKAIGNVVANAEKALAGLFGSNSRQTTAQPAPKQAAPAAQLTKVVLTSSKLVGYRAANHINPMVFSTFYFRILPMKDGKAVGGGSNMAVIHWGGNEDPMADLKLPNPTATPTPTPSAYETEITSYHGVIPPQKSSACYVVTQDVWKVGLLAYSTKPFGNGPPSIKQGQVLCPPEPTGKSLLDMIADWVTGGVNWVSEAYSDLKNTVVSAVGYLIPDALCDNSCVGFVLDATLASMGIPPDIPNFDQLMNQGLDYLAEQAVAQVGLPLEVLNQTGPYAGLALSEAEDKFKEEAQAKIKEGLQKGLTEMQLDTGRSAGWIPPGIPVRHDDYQPPAMTIKVTRKPGVPGGDSGCTLEVNDSLTIDHSKLTNPPQGWESALKEVNDLQPLSSLTSYDFFANRASEDYHVDYKIPVPPLAPGKSTTIPVSFDPNVYKNGWNPLGMVSTDDYFLAWNVMHELGTVHLSTSGCGSANVDVPAKTNVVGMEIVGGN